MEAEAGLLAEPGQPGVFQPHIVVGVEIVQADDRIPTGEQPGRNMKADKTGRSGD